MSEKDKSRKVLYLQNGSIFVVLQSEEEVRGMDSLYYSKKQLNSLTNHKCVKVEVGDIIKIPLSTITKDFGKWVRKLKDFSLIGNEFMYKRPLFKMLHFPEWHIFGERYVTYQYIGSRKEG